MAFIFMEPWLSYANGTGDLDQNGWSLAGTTGYAVASSDPRDGYGKYLDMGNVSFEILHSVADTATIFLNSSYLFLGSANSCLAVFKEGTTRHITIMYKNTDSKIYAYRVDAGGTLLATSTLTVSANDWHHAEIKVVINDTTGVVIVNIDGVEFINFSGDTRNAGTGVINSIGFGGPLADYLGDFKYVGQVFIFNATGSFWNDFQGDIYALAMPPTSDATPNQFTPSSGADHYALVDEIVPDGDTTYLESSTDAQQCLYAPDALPATVSELLGVVLENVSRKTDIDDNQISNFLKVSTTDTISTSTGLSTSYTYSRNIYESNPDTAVAWSLSDWSNISFGFENQVP